MNGKNKAPMTIGKKISLRKWCIEQAMKNPALHKTESIIEEAQEIYDWVTQSEEVVIISPNPQPE